jgi:hypothetical protein
VKADGTSISQDAPFPPKTFDSDKWAEVYQNLKLDIAGAFDIMSQENQLRSVVPKTDMQTQNGIRSAGPRFIPQLLRYRLEISVRKPDQAHFSIVDIPGFVNSKFQC